jgi:hypothetical protein
MRSGAGSTGRGRGRAVQMGRVTRFGTRDGMRDGTRDTHRDPTRDGTRDGIRDGTRAALRQNQNQNQNQNQRPFLYLTDGRLATLCCYENLRPRAIGRRQSMDTR